MREFFYVGVAPARGLILARSRSVARWAKAVWLICLLASLLPSAYAQTTTRGFGNGANQFTMDFVTIGNPNNPADTTGQPNPAGSVAYTYNLGKHEVSRDMINKANAAGGLGITLPDMTSFGGNGINRPATGISWYEAAKYVNWLNTSTGGTAAYKFSGSTFQLWSAGDAGYNANNPFRNSLAKYWLPSSDEWYKGAYGSPSGTWYNFATGSDTIPTAVTGGTNASTAVYSQTSATGPADITNAGGLSAYGTMAQSGNIHEWMETATDGINNSAAENRDWRGGRWTDGFSTNLNASSRFNSPPTDESATILGFRVASADLTALDSDGDGLSDAVETNTGVFVSASGTGTNPNNPDTDGDGISDDVEVNTLNSNPNVSQIPEALLAQQSGPDGFVATWGAVTGAAGYEVQVSTERSFTSGLIGGDRTVSLGTTTSLGITGISSQIRYYRVRSVLPSLGGPLKTAWSPAVSAPNRSAFGKYATLNATGNADTFQAAVESSANNNSYTISFWMRPDRLGGVSGSENVQVFRQPINNNASAANVDIDLLPDGSLVFGQRSEAGEEHFVSTPADTVLPGNWVHVTAVRDAANAALRLYINGMEIAAKTLAFGTNTWNIVNSGGPGATQAALNNDSNANRIRAAFDDVRIYRAVRTPVQILEGMSMPLNKIDANSTANTSLVFYAPLEGSNLSNTPDTNTIYKGVLNTGVGITNSGVITSQSVLTAPVLTWTPSPINLVAPAVLSAIELTATATAPTGGPVSGNWSYLPAAGTSLSIGTNAVVGTFVPTDLVTYAIGTITNQIVVTEPSYSVPGVETGPTNSISGLTQTSVKLMGGIMNLGGTTVTNAGFYLNTNSPATNGVKYSAPGSSFALGSFSNTITGLTPGTSYTYRAFAANSVGTGYGASEYSFTTPSPFTYTNNGTGLTITGYTGTGGAVEIPATIGGFPVRVIGYRAFDDNKEITGVVVPEGVTHISAEAFQRCNNLASITLPTTLVEIGSYAFLDCKIRNLVIPEGVIEIKNNAFMGCGFMETVQLPSTLIQIGNGAFDSCGQLTEIIIPTSVSNIGVNAFMNCGLLGTVIFQGVIPPVFDGNAFSGIAAGAKGYYPATASAEWGLVNQIGGLTIVHPDTQSPVITLIGANPLQINKGATFSDPGATVTDNVDASRTITGSGTVNTATVGNYTLNYNATDAAGNPAVQVTRTVNVVLDPTIDTDGDGISDVNEISWGMDPNAKQTAVYDFNSLSNGNLNGQDGWKTSVYGTGGDGQVITWTSNDSKAVQYAGSGPGAGVSGTRLNNAAYRFPQQGAGKTIVEIDVQPAFWGMVFGMGLDANGDGLFSNADIKNSDTSNTDMAWWVKFAKNTNGWQFYSKGTAATTTGNGGTGNSLTYARVRVVLDYEANGGSGSASVFVRDLGVANSAFAPVSGLQNLNLGLNAVATGVTNPRNWNGLGFHIEGATGVLDNLSISNDTDGDGLVDQVETRTGTYVSASNTGTNPTNSDTDGDGTQDGAEVAAGTNPNLAQLKPTLTWTPSPINLVAPAVLSTSELTATAGSTLMGPILPGTWSYSPAAGASLSVGTNAVVGTFVPTDLVTYAVGTITNQVVVTAPSYSVPEVETGPTNSISGLTPTSVKLMGGIMNLGGTTVTNAGFYLNTNSTATNGVKYSAPGTSFALGSFSNTITGLAPGTSYTYRAFAANSVGTGYGASEYTFSTPAPSPFTYTNNGAGLTITGYTGTGGNVVIPATLDGFPVTTIGQNAFQSKTSVTSVVIPNGVTTILDAAFAGCSSMTAITLPNSLTSIGNFVFDGCSSLQSITIPDGVTSIGSNAFAFCTSLPSIMLPSGLNKIMSGTFWTCTNLTSITIPSSVNEIEYNAFLNCSKLASVYFLRNTPPKFGSPTPFGGIAAGAKGYYPATASAEWGLVNQIGGLTIVHPDTQSPVITLIGANPLQINKGATFSDPGATVTDNRDVTRSITGTGTVNAGTVGNYTLNYNATDAAGNPAVEVTRTVNVVKATPIITAPTAAPITYGQTLASSTLTGGTASTGGTFAFTTPSTTPNVGTANQGVTFTPSDTANYNTATGSVSVTVGKATPTISAAPTASAITYGQTLASSTLTGGTASTGGTFAFTTPSTAPNAGTASQSVTFTPTDTANYNTATASVNVTVNAALISSGFSHTLYLGAGATTVTAWGMNTDGRLGVGDTASPVNWARAVQGIPANVEVEDLAAGGTHSLILAGGEVYAAGSDRFGQLGQGAVNGANKTSFTPVAIPSSTPVAVAAGGNHSLIVTASGKVFACGDNTYGQLAQPATTLSSGTLVEVVFPGLSTKIVSVVAGADHNLAVDENGGVWVWGRNDSGQLGKNTRTLGVVADRTPVRIISSGAKSLAAGYAHSLILKQDGSVLGFGRNTLGQTGQSSGTSYAKLPIPISGLSGIRLISAGTDSSFAIDGAGQLRSWGYNAYGELLLGYASPSSSPAVYGPTPSPIATNVFNVSGGGYSSLAVGVQGVIFGGRNDVGQAGNGPDPDEVVGDYYYGAGDLALTNLTMDLAGTEPSLYDQIFLGNGAVTLNGILNLMFVGTYTGPVYGSTQTFDLIWAKNGITLGTDYKLAFNQSGYWAETERVAQDGGEVLRATVGAVVTAADLVKAVQAANPILENVTSTSYGAFSVANLSSGSQSSSQVEMIYSYERPTGGVMSGAEYIVGGTTYRVQQGSSVNGPWSNASVSGTTVTPLGNSNERVTLRISSSGSAGFLQLQVETETLQATEIGAGAGSATSN